MFSLFKKKQQILIKHQYKNLNISLPNNWQFETEEGDLEACFDPKSQSTLRLHIMKIISKTEKEFEEGIDDLTGDLPYIKTPKGYFLTNPISKEIIERSHDIFIITWRLINYSNKEKIIAIVTYTIPSSEKDSSREKEQIEMIEEQLKNAELV